MPSSALSGEGRSPAAPGVAPVPRLRGARLFAALVAAPLVLACRSPEEHRAAADREVYAILEQRRAALFGAGGEAGFTIEPPRDTLRERLLAGTVDELKPLDLVDCLRVASENSREYRTRREALYLSALDLTFERWRYRIQRAGSLGAQYTAAVPGQEPLELDAGASLTRLLGTGALVIGDIGLSLFRNLSEADGWDVVSDVGLSITQPLLRGFGAEVVREPLTRAEREVVYEVRAYERFRRSFAVDVATRMYRILQQRDVVENERSNLDNLSVLRARNEELATAGRLADIQVDQARQDELRSRDRLIDQEQRYESLLDDFKLFLGLPIDVALECDPAELAELETALEVAGLGDAGGLVEVALAERLDLRSTLERVEDAERAVMVAADGLRAGLGLSVDGALVSEEGRPLDVSWDASSIAVGLDLDLPIDRLPERNAFRAAEVALQAARRSAEEQADTIRADVRQLVRETNASREAYEIQVGAVALAERRVESARLRLDAGRADTRDILEAQEDLVDAQNASTAALIDLRLAQLALFRDLELLRVDEDGVSLERAALEGARAAAPRAPAHPRSTTEEGPDRARS